MGFFDQNSTHLGNDITFPVVEGYCGSVGAAMAAIDGQMNDFALFEAALKYDFTEAMALREGADIELLQEASLKGIADRIIEFLKKLGAKIKALFTSIMAKLDSYITKDSKKFVEKYEKKLAGKDLKDMKAKYAAPKDGYIYDKNYDFSIDVLTLDTKNDFDREEFIEKQLGNALGESSCSSKDFKKELHDKMYETEEVKDDWTSGDLMMIGKNLKGSDKPMTALRKKNESLQNGIKKAIDAIQKSKNKVVNKYSGDGATYDSSVKTAYSMSVNATSGKYDNTSSSKYTDKDTAKAGVDFQDKLLKQFGIAQQEANAHQSAIMTYCAAIMSEAKWGIAQDRRVFAQAVAYKALKEEASLAEAVGDVAEQECLAVFEEFEICA